MLAKRVEWYGPLEDTEGFAEEGRGLIGALRAAGIEVDATSIPHPRTFDRVADMRDIDALPSAAIRIYHRYWTAAPGPGPAVNVWRSMFETDAIPPEWSESAKTYDQIWVPSSFNVGTYARSGVPESKLAIVPCPLPTWAKLLAKSASRQRRMCPERFTFLSVMRWHLRKGWDLLLQAFAREFGRESQVRLIIKARPFDPRDPEGPRRQMSRFFVDQGLREPSNVTLITEDLKHEQLARLYETADAFVLPSRGEGWGRPFIEAMLSGLPTIGPRWGGSLEYMNDDNSHLVDGIVAPVQPEAVAEWGYFAGHRWFETSVEQLQLTMRELVEGGRPLRSAPAQTARAILKAYSAASIGEVMKNHLAPWG